MLPSPWGKRTSGWLYAGATERHARRFRNSALADNIVFLPKGGGSRSDVEAALTARPALACI